MKIALYRNTMFDFDSVGEEGYDTGDYVRVSELVDIEFPARVRGDVVKEQIDKLRRKKETRLIEQGAEIAEMEEAINDLLAIAAPSN